MKKEKELSNREKLLCVIYEMLDIPLGLVQNVLATSPEFIRLPNGFYDLANKETNLK